MALKSYHIENDLCPVCNRNSLLITGQDMYEEGTECAAYCDDCSWHIRVEYPEKAVTRFEYTELFTKFRRVFPS